MHNYVVISNQLEAVCGGPSDGTFNDACGTMAVCAPIRGSMWSTLVVTRNNLLHSGVSL